MYFFFSLPSLSPFSSAVFFFLLFRWISFFGLRFSGCKLSTLIGPERSLGSGSKAGDSAAVNLLEQQVGEARRRGAINKADFAITFFRTKKEKCFREVDTFWKRYPKKHVSHSPKQTQLKKSKDFSTSGHVPEFHVSSIGLLCRKWMARAALVSVTAFGGQCLHK